MLLPDAETAYRIADTALYEAKRGGRDRVVPLPGTGRLGATVESARAV